MTKDPDDDRIVECAVAGRAEYIITGDHALLELNQYKGITICTPRQFSDQFIAKAT